ncbi:MAG TPA: hypothetical protein VNF68_01495 [Candidatus Baltobacteraceae bacterium]|nr:hypothetical protein [Candidatus Baltobacteraceae bacterium]
MRLNSLALVLAFVAAAGVAANAHTMMKASPKPSPSAMHGKSMMKSNHMKATPKPNAMHGSHMMAHPTPKASSQP